ncbi:hypothetical protein P7K49_026007, partial [Saguinus oedipus]
HQHIKIGLDRDTSPQGQLLAPEQSHSAIKSHTHALAPLAQVARTLQDTNPVLPPDPTGLLPTALSFSNKLCGEG